MGIHDDLLEGETVGPFMRPNATLNCKNALEKSTGKEYLKDDCSVPEIIAMLLEELYDLLHGVSLLQQLVHCFLKRTERSSERNRKVSERNKKVSERNKRFLKG